MKLINTFVITALLCAASVQVHAADVQAVPAANDKPVLLTRAQPSARSPEVVVPERTWDVGRRQAQEAAAKGPDALRRYIDRTRMIYALQYADFVRE